MDEVKGFLTSRTMWGLIVTGIALLLRVFGFDVSSEEQSILVNTALDIVSLSGVLFAAYGRIKATKTIGKK
jgi:hypothetical protein